jgi:NADPH2:quinone reductase
MRALQCVSFGPPESLVIEDLPDPVPGPGVVVVAVAAAALNFFDTLIIENRYQFKPPLPFSPGGELAGRIVALGEGVTHFAVGERVAAYVGWGACRSHVLVRADQLIRIPDALSDEMAAGLLVTYGTSLHALADRARLRAGETLAVLGASGGVGLAAVELGVQMGARVIACASSSEKLAIAREHGAHDFIDYSQENLRDALKRRVPHGVDVIYDPIGGEFSEMALRAIGWKGRFLVVGFAAGDIPKLPLNLALLKGCDVLGVFWGAFAEKEPETHRANTARLFQWAAEGRLRVHIGARYPLERGVAALRLIADRRATGKVIVTP